MTERVMVGRITEAHGLRGEVRIASYTAVASDIASYGALTDAAGTSTYEIASHRGAKPGQVIARLKGVTSRDAAEKLAGIKLYVAREAMPPAEADEFYHADLIGLHAITPRGEPIGEVISVQNFGAGDLLEIRLEASGNIEFVPFTNSHVPKIELAERRIIVDYDFNLDGDETTPQK